MIAKIIKDLRVKNEISARDLAERINMNHAYISQIETGRIKFPKLENLKIILKQLGCSDEEIECIILNECEDVEKQVHGSTKNAYKLERRFLLSGKEKVDYGKNLLSFSLPVLTKKQYEVKCKNDAENLYSQLKELPEPTLLHLMDLLVEDI